MADSNITVSGNLTRDPELKYTGTGKAVCSVGVAVNRRFQQAGEWQEQTSFMNIVAWEGLAENLAASFSKGDRVIVTGRLEVREYQKSDGSKGYSTEIIANDIGASIRWATAEVTRVAKSSGGFSNDKAEKAVSDIEKAFAPSNDSSNDPF